MIVATLRYRLICLALVLAGSCASSVAQYHTAPWTLMGPGGANAAIARVDAQGTVTTVLAGSGLPANVFPTAGTIDADDRTFVVALLSKAINGSLLIVDQAGVIQQTITISASAPRNGGGFIQDVVLDDDGSYLVVEGQGGGTNANLIRVLRGGALQTVYKGTPMIDPVGVQVEMDTGDYRVLDRNTKTVYGISRDGTSITSIGVLPSSSFNRFGHQVSCGDFFVGSFATSLTGASVWKMSPGGTVSTFLGTALPSVYGVQWDRTSAARERMVVSSSGSRGGLYYIDDQSRTVSTWTTTPNVTWADVIAPREVASIESSPRQWQFLLHFAGQGGKNFAMGFSLRGVRPKIPLGDGRTIFFAIDDLTPLSLSGQLAPVLINNVGVLSGADRAVVQLDMRPLPGVTGINLFGVVVVLDPAASRGVAVISDPIRIRL